MLKLHLLPNWPQFHRWLHEVFASFPFFRHGSVNCFLVKWMIGFVFQKQREQQNVVGTGSVGSVGFSVLGEEYGTGVKLGCGKAD
jgi:hypothetical protein